MALKGKLRLFADDSNIFVSGKSFSTKIVQNQINIANKQPVIATTNVGTALYNAMLIT